MTDDIENQIDFIPKALKSRISDYIRRSDPEEIASLSKKIDAYIEQSDRDFQATLASDPRILQTNLSKKDLETKTFSSFSRTVDNSELADRFFRWKPQDRYGIFCHGAYGTGKSHLLKGLVIKHHNPQQFCCYYISANDLFEILRDPTNKEGEQKLLIPNMLAVDDLGNEYLTEFVSKRFLNFLDKRIASNGLKINCVTTNLSLEELDKMYDKRSLDRLKETMIFCEARGRTFRDNFYIKHFSHWKKS